MERTRQVAAASNTAAKEATARVVSLGSRRTRRHVARCLFYLLQLLNMLIEIRTGMLMSSRSRRGFLPWPVNELQLSAQAIRWCRTPRSLMALDGGKALVDALLRALIPGPQCELGMSCLATANFVAILLAALTSFWPWWFGRAARRVPAVVCAATFLALEATFEACSDSNHRFLLVGVCCAALALDDPIAPSEAVRELCASAAACIFGAAGISKLTGAGAGRPSLQWAYGGSLRWMLLKNGAMLLQNGKKVAWMDWLLARPTIVHALGAGSLLLEVASLALLAPPTLLPQRSHEALLVLLCAGWAAFHVGILLTMPNVNYLPSVIMYSTLLVLPSPLFGSRAEVEAFPPTAPVVERLARVCRAALIFGFAVATMLHTEAWPFSCVPSARPPFRTRHRPPRQRSPLASPHRQLTAIRPPTNPETTFESLLASVFELARPELEHGVPDGRAGRTSRRREPLPHLLLPALVPRRPCRRADRGQRQGRPVSPTCAAAVLGHTLGQPRRSLALCEAHTGAAAAVPWLPPATRGGEGDALGLGDGGARLPSCRSRTASSPCAHWRGCGWHDPWRGRHPRPV